MFDSLLKLSKRVLAAALTTTALTAAALTTSCANASVISDDAQRRINRNHEGELLFVKQSLYAGPFYDDDRYRLVHTRRFEELTYLVNAEGEPITPPPATEIIPAGTRVRIERIEWPDGDAVFRRPLYTPRYTTWIFLRVARGVGSGVTMERAERHIMLLPGGLDDEETFEAWFQAALSPTDPTPWLNSLDARQREAIAAKRPAQGMTYEALTASLGFPDRITESTDDDGHLVEVGIWGATSVVLKDGVVERFSEGAVGRGGASVPVAQAP